VLRAAVAALALLAAGPDAPAELFVIQDPDIRESSGVAVSSRDDEVLFTHNDSGDAPRFFAIDAIGCTVGRYTVAGAEANDWEDMASGPEHKGKPTLWLGDIGDNAAQRPAISLYRVAEPKVKAPDNMRGACAPPVDEELAATRFDLEYADGAHDAEALLVHPKTGRVYVVTKGVDAQMYAAPKRLRAGEVNVLEPVAPLELRVGLVTAGDFSPDGKHLVLRNYSEAFEWRVRKDDPGASLSDAPVRDPTLIPLPPAPQGEAIAYSADGDSLITTTEDPAGAGAQVYRVPR
jgi:hypothetical protein